MKAVSMNHPHLGQQHSLDRTAWQAEAANVGHVQMPRALPTQPVQAVGPFAFLDHFGPTPARGETLPAHPHAGIEVMAAYFGERDRRFRERDRFGAGAGIA